jgi:hypothetical protein
MTLAEAQKRGREVLARVEASRPPERGISMARLLEVLEKVR